jgi:UDP-glucose 4-epimerase
MRTAWVIGSGGLLGSALRACLAGQGDALYVHGASLRWNDREILAAQLEAAVTAFAAGIEPSDRWEIYWAAGIGTMASPAEALVPETEALEIFLRLLGANKRLACAPGAMVLASSAGAIYAGATDDIITEDTPVAPTTPYARAKLQQEALVGAFIDGHANVSALLGRISTLYGAGQGHGKKQGLLTHIARSLVRNKPIQIYVPFDTIRDYIHAADAAARLVFALRGLSPSRRQVVKIIASENPTTIAEIISTFKRVARRAPLVVTSASRQAALYTRRIQFRSIESTQAPDLPDTSLVVGVAQLLKAELAHFVRASHK